MRRPNVKEMIERMKKVRAVAEPEGPTLVQACEYIEWLERLLADLTPGGSEFHQNPQFCADFVRKRLASQAPAALKQRIKLLEEIIQKGTEDIDSTVSTLEYAAPELHTELRERISYRTSWMRGSKSAAHEDTGPG